MPSSPTTSPYTLSLHDALPIFTNAQAFLKIQAEYGTFADYIWRFVDGKPIMNHWKTHADVPASTALSESMSKQLKKDGFTFVGGRSEEHTSELQSRFDLVCRLLPPPRPTLFPCTTLFRSSPMPKPF